MSKVILCVDDSVTMQTVAEITFRATDYVYVGARSVEEGLDKARAQRPALVLADAVMTGKNGYDLCHAMKSDGALASVPVVILCGNSAPYDATRGTQVGADGTLTKPWDTQVMLDKIAEMLDKFAQAGVARAGKPAAAATPAPVAPPPVAQAVPTPVAPVTTPLVAPVSAPVPSPMPAAAAAAQSAAQKAQPPRSATIMGMPTIKMPGPASGPTTAAQPTPASGVHAMPTAPAAAREPGFGGANRPPMVAGVPTKRSVLVERTLAKMGERLAELSGLAPGSPELVALVKLSSEIVERVVWEVVPELAETIIREHVAELAAKRAN